MEMMVAIVMILAVMMAAVMEPEMVAVANEYKIELKDI